MERRRRKLSKWEEKRFRELCSDISYGYTESATYSEVGPKFLRITDITSDYINWEKVPFCKISEQDFEKYKLQYNDIVIARTGATSGYNQQFRENIDAVYASYLIRFRIDESKAYPRFVYYYLQSSAYKGFVNNYISGAAQPGINATVLSKLKIPLPDEKTQKHIVTALSAYDDLIEANNRRIELLEQIAQELYKEWFIRFRFPGHENTKFENGIPKGWNFGKFKNELTYNTGKLDSNAAVCDGEYSFYTCAKTVYKTNTFCFDGECVLLGGNNATGDFSLFYANEKLDAYQRTYIVVPQNPLLSCVYIYFVLKDYLLQFKTASIGATTKFLTKGMLDKAKILIPDDKTIVRYNEMTKSMFDQIVALKSQNENLISQRDMLLPRLMSGKLEV